MSEEAVISTRMGRTSWLQSLTKEEVINLACEFVLSDNGTEKELRRQLKTFIRNGQHDERTRQRLANLELQYSRGDSDSPFRGFEDTTAPSPRSGATHSRADTFCSRKEMHQYHHRCDILKRRHLSSPLLIPERPWLT